MNCFSEIFFSTLSQQKLMRKKFLVKQKYLLILKNKNKMKNLKNLNLVELKSINGGELPYTENAINSQGLLKDLHNTVDAARGFVNGLFGKKIL